MNKFREKPDSIRGLFYQFFEKDEARQETQARMENIVPFDDSACITSQIWNMFFFAIEQTSCRPFKVPDFVDLIAMIFLAF